MTETLWAFVAPGASRMAEECLRQGMVGKSWIESCFCTVWQKWWLSNDSDGPGSSGWKVSGRINNATVYTSAIKNLGVFPNKCVQDRMFEDISGRGQGKRHAAIEEGSTERFE